MREYKLYASDVTLARLVAAKNPTNAAIRLRTVASFIAAGKNEDAAKQLEQTSNEVDVLPEFGKFRHYATVLQRLELVERVLEGEAAQALPLERKIELGFQTASAYEAAKRNIRAAQRLEALAVLCKDRPAELSRIADWLVRLGAHQSALRICEKRVVAAPDDITLALAEVHARIGVNRDAAHAALKALERRMLDRRGAEAVAFWERASQLYDRLHYPHETDDAIAATRKALACGADAVASRVRLARLHAAQHQARQARREMQSLLHLDHVPAASLASMVKLALACKDPKLATRLAEKRHAIDRSEPDAVLSLADTLTRRGKVREARPLLRELWRDVQAGQPLPAASWAALAEAFARIGELETDNAVIEAGLRLYPTDETLRQRRRMVMFISERVAATARRSATHRHARFGAAEPAR